MSVIEWQVAVGQMGRGVLKCAQVFFFFCDFARSRTLYDEALGEIWNV